MNRFNLSVTVLVRSMGRPELTVALESVYAQTWERLQVVVLNASGLSHPALPPDFRVEVALIEPGRAVPRARAANLLLEQAKGDFVLLLDDDDWLAPNHIERLVMTLLSSPDCVLAYSGVDCVSLSGDGRWETIRRYDEIYDPVRLRFENYIPIHAALLRRSVLAQADAPHFDEAFDLYEDWDFWLQCQQKGSFARAPGVSAFYRITPTHGEGVQTGNPERAVAAFHALLEKWRNRWSNVELGQVWITARHLKPALERIEGADQELRQLRERSAVLAQELCASQAKLESTVAEYQAAQQQYRLAEQQAAAELQAVRQATEQQVAGLQRHIATLDAQLHLIWSDWSWRLTRPLRGVTKAYRELRAQVSSGLHRLGLAVYRNETLAPLVWLIPESVKHGVRNWLLRGSSQLLPPAEMGLWINTPTEVETEPLVTILIPVYNHSAYIKQCIESALAQDWTNLEVVVVDDASPEPQVQQILGELAAQPRLRIFYNPQNLGICRTQNRALLESKGSIIAFLDCDDYLPANAISTAMAAWRPDTVYLHTGRINIDEQGLEISRIHFASLLRENYFEENLKAMYATHLKLIKRAVFAKVGIFDDRFDSAQDYEMLMRIAFRYPSSAFVHVPEFLYFHRFHTGQTTERQRRKQGHLTLQIQKEARLRAAIRAGKYERFLSIIMLSYGKHTQTLRAIQGLEKTVRVPHEVILYDNGSSTETVEFLRSQIGGQFPNVRVFYGDHNLGPAHGRREALKYARGEWFIVFDNDEVPELGWLEELLLRAEVNDGVGAVCCRVIFPDETLQFSGGQVIELGDGFIDLALYDRGRRYDELESCQFREVDWCPIGATLFTRNIAEFLHAGYPNAFEDSGVSFALKKQGLRLLNAPGALVWHDHIIFQPKAEMKEQYMRDRYNAKLMLRSVSSFYRENGLIIKDEYVWRENQLTGLSKEVLVEKLLDPTVIAREFS
ncbi:MAG: glycosyltransferase [Nitrosomonas sp.]|nr:glycosyltransferase [Nitrosomonas sp.]